MDRDTHQHTAPSSRTAQPSGFQWPFPLSRVRLWRELAALACLGMTLTWSVPWFRSLSQATYAISSVRVFIILGLMGLAAYLSVKGMVQFQLHPKIRLRVMLGLLMISILVGLRTMLGIKPLTHFGELIVRPFETVNNFSALIPNEFLVIVVVLLSWRRGASLAHAAISPQTVQGDFKGGLIAFILFTLFNTLATGETVPILMIQGFFLFGLLAMGMARIATLGELRGGTNSPFERRRIFSLVLTALVMVEIAYGIAYVMSGDEAAIPAFLLALAFLAVLLFSIPILLLLVYAVFWLILNYQEQIAQFFERAGGVIEEFFQFLNRVRTGVEQVAAMLAEKFAFLKPILHWLINLAPWVRAVLLLSIVLFLIGLVLVTLYIRERRRRGVYGEELEAVFSAQDLLKLLRDAIRQRGQEAGKFLAGLMLPNERQRAAARVRQIYAELMDLCSELHHPRPEALTPLEFLPRLDKVFPASRQELETITSAYIKVRYGELPEPRGEVQAIEVAWKHVKEEGEKRRKGDKEKRG